MAARARDHEPPAAPAVAAVLLGCVAFYQGLIVPADALGRHALFGIVFGVVGLLAGWRALAIAGRRRGPRTWAWVGIAIAAVGLGMLAYQALVIATGGAVPPPFWSPYATA